jgi:hypothetical protein
LKLAMKATSTAITSMARKIGTSVAPIHTNTAAEQQLASVTTEISTMNPRSVSERCGVITASI